MQYEKYLVVASKKDRAGINITTQLSQFRNPTLEKEYASLLDSLDTTDSLWAVAKK